MDLKSMLVKLAEEQADKMREEAVSHLGSDEMTEKIASAINKPFIAVDTHLFRLGNRIGLAKGKNVLEVENNYLKIIPNWAMKDAHHWLILHGRYVCKARNPECNVCKIKEFCEFFKKEIYYG